MSRRRTSIAGSPMLIGAVTVLVVVVAVFVSYNAHRGLPFVPTYQIDVQVPNAAGLIRGNEVRTGGARIGIVDRIAPLARPDGTTGAVLRLKLNAETELPRDSTFAIRPRSALGLKYVEIHLGDADELYASGDVVPLGEQPPRTEIDDFFDMWDAPTRAASARNLDAFGTGFAGRGAELNAALRGLNPLLDHAGPVLTALNDPATGFGRLFPAFEQAASEVAPVAAVQAALLGHMSVTFRALADASDGLQESIALGPRALDVATRELPAQAPFLAESTELFARLRPAFSSLAAASPEMAVALREGEPALQAAPALNARVEELFVTLEGFAGDPRVSPGLRRLAHTATLLGPPIAFATPAQTECNYLALFFRNLGSALSESDEIGSFLRVGILALPQLPNSEAGPSSAPANGPASRVSTEEDSFLHSNPYPNTAAPGQPRECEAGNERYEAGRQVIGNPPGNQGLFHDETTRELE